MRSLFFPDRINKARSFLAHPQKGLLIYLGVLLLLFMGGNLIQKSPRILGYATNITVSDLLSYTNKLREKSGQDRLVLNEKLSKAAMAKAEDMFKDDYWAHVAPDGTKPWDFIKANNYAYIYAGENLAVDFSDSEDVVSAWYDSESHRDNLLSGNYSEVGFAIKNGTLQGRKTTLVVQMFGKPRPINNIVAKKAEVNTQSPIEIETGQIPAIATQERSEVSLFTNQDQPESIVEAIAIDSTQEIGEVLNSSDIFGVSKYISMILGVFVALVFALDGYYVRRFGIFRVTGHTVLHVMFLVMVLVAIWYTNIGLVL